MLFIKDALNTVAAATSEVAAAAAAIGARDTYEKIDAFWTQYHNTSSPLFVNAYNSSKSQESAEVASRIDVPGYGLIGFGVISSGWYGERAALDASKNKGRGRGRGAGTKKIEPKKPEVVPPPGARVVTFGKMFTSFCLPALTAQAREEGLDEVQVNFYQLNESCGPISLHSVAEFPIEIDYAEQLFATKALKVGGESMTIFEFVNWCALELFTDKRAPGYAMRDIYEPASTEPATGETKKDEAADAAKNSAMQAWFDKYKTFKPPILTMKLDVVYENDNNKIDLLYKLQHRVGAQYNAPPPRFAEGVNGKIKRILRVDLYDRSYDPYSKSSSILKDADGSYRAFEGSPSGNEVRDFTKSYARQYAAVGGDEIKVEKRPGNKAGLMTNKVTINGTTVGGSFSSGKNVLKDYVGESVPRLTIGGTNGTMIMNAQVQSKTSGIQGSINVTGGSYKVKSTVAPNALSMSENNLPMRTSPGEVTLNTIGCPLADLQQNFFLDFETGTTLDNLYSVKQVQHNFGQGKFETSWTMVYTDGYAKFFGAASVNDELREMKKDTDQKNEQQENSGDPPLAPPPNVQANNINTDVSK